MLSRQVRQQPNLGPTTIQPIGVFFDFVLNGKTSDSGNVRFKLLVNNRFYGPYQTTLETTFTNWNDHKRPKVPVSARLLKASLFGIRCHIVQTWISFEPLTKPVNVRLLLARTRYKLIEGKGGPVYVV